ncbi:unnamed protein product, partial [Prorocentrum cordatum]
DYVDPMQSDLLCEIQNITSQVYVGPDRNPAMVQKEMFCKTIKRIQVDSYPNRVFYVAEDRPIPKDIFFSAEYREFLGPAIDAADAGHPPQAIARLRLKTAKCVLAPVGSPLTDILEAKIKNWLVNNIPDWNGFEAAPAAMHLGLWIGPGASSEPWATRQLKHFLVHVGVARASSEIACRTRNRQCIAVLSYPAQRLHLPPTFQEKKCTHFSQIFHMPHSRLKHADWIQLEKWRGPKLTSTQALSPASLMRAGLFTFNAWQPAMQELAESTDACLSLPAIARGKLSADFWKGIAPHKMGSLALWHNIESYVTGPHSHTICSLFELVFLGLGKPLPTDPLHACTTQMCELLGARLEVEQPLPQLAILLCEPSATETTTGPTKVDPAALLEQLASLPQFTKEVNTLRQAQERHKESQVVQVSPQEFYTMSAKELKWEADALERASKAELEAEHKLEVAREATKCLALEHARAKKEHADAVTRVAAEANIHHVPQGYTSDGKRAVFAVDDTLFQDIGASDEEEQRVLRALEATIKEKCDQDQRGEAKRTEQSNEDSPELLAAAEADRAAALEPERKRIANNAKACGKGPNEKTLVRLASFLSMVKEPWLVIFDWNTHPSEWATTSWLERLGAQVIIPSNGEVTCNRGRGTLIDYAIAKRGIPTAMKLSIAPEVTLKTHAGLAQEVKDSGEESAPSNIDHEAWEQARMLEKTQAPFLEEKREPVPHFLPDRDMPARGRLAPSYADWATTPEEATIITHKLEQQEADMVRGRAKGYACRWERTRATPDRLHLRDPVAEWWNICSTLIKRAGVLRQSQRISGLQVVFSKIENLMGINNITDMLAIFHNEGKFKCWLGMVTMISGESEFPAVGDSHVEDYSRSNPQERELITAEQIYEATASMNAKKSKGIDVMGPVEVQRLPRAGPGRRLTTSLAMVYGNKDPAKSLKMWLKMRCPGSCAGSGDWALNVVVTTGGQWPRERLLQ